MCNLEQVSSQFCASIFSIAKWNKSIYFIGLFCMCEDECKEFRTKPAILEALNIAIYYYLEFLDGSR